MAAVVTRVGGRLLPFTLGRPETCITNKLDLPLSGRRVPRPNTLKHDWASGGVFGAVTRFVARTYYRFRQFRTRRRCSKRVSVSPLSFRRRHFRNRVIG